MNARRLVSTTFTLALLAGCSPPLPPEQQFVNDALEAIGGRARIEAVRSVVIEGTGVNYNLGQDTKPEASTQTFEITGYSRKLDVEQGRQRVQQTRTPKFPYFQGPQPQTQIMGLDGEVSYNIAPSGAASRLGAQGEFDRRMDFFHHPVTALRAATAAQTKITNVRSAGAARQADFQFRDLQWTMTIDAAGLPVSVSNRSAHPNLGDVVMTTAFADYQDVNGLKLPARLSGTVDDFTTWEIRAAKQAVDVDLGDLAAPAAVLKGAVMAQPNVTVEPIAKGVWFLAGQSHHSVLVEFSDHLMLIEAPQSEARTLAVIAAAKKTVPEKALTELVTTHHHFDHTAGMRAAIAEGMTVITQAGNQDWVERMARRPHTIQPDALANAVSRLRIDAVDSEKTITDNTMQVQLFHVAGNPHSDTMMMAYIPSARVLVEVDAFSPGPGAHPYAANLLENIQKRNLRVDRIVPLHGAITPFAEFVRAAGGKGN